MKNYVLAAVAVILLVIGGIVGRTLFPVVQTKETVTERVKKDIVTVVKEVVRPDGTKETTTTTTDNSVESTNKTVVQSKKQSDWQVSASVSRTSLTDKDVYGIQVQKRILGNINAGLRAETNGSVGLVLGMEF